MWEQGGPSGGMLMRIWVCFIIFVYYLLFSFHFFFIFFYVFLFIFIFGFSRGHSWHSTPLWNIILFYFFCIGQYICCIGGSKFHDIVLSLFFIVFYFCKILCIGKYICCIGGSKFQYIIYILYIYIYFFDVFCIRQYICCMHYHGVEGGESVNREKHFKKLNQNKIKYIKIYKDILKYMKIY